MFKTSSILDILSDEINCTFVEGPASQNVSPVGETRSSGADGLVLGRTGFRALLAVDAPGGTHRAAAHVHAVPAGKRLATLVLVPLHVALLAAQIWAKSGSLKSGACDFLPVDFLPFSFLTDARAPGAVQCQALGALAAEGALSVDALAVCAHAGEDFTLVDVCGNLKRMHKKAILVHALGAERKKINGHGIATRLITFADQAFHTSEPSRACSV